MTFQIYIFSFQEMNLSPHRTQWYGISLAWFFMWLFVWFLEMNPLPHRAHWYGFSQCYCSCVSLAGSLRWIYWLLEHMDIIPGHTEYIDINSPQCETSCVSIDSFWRWNPFNTEYSVMDSPQNESLCGSWRWIPRHREHSDLDCLQQDSSCVYLCSSR